MIAKHRLQEMAECHGDCMMQAMAWYRLAAKVTWRNLVEVRRDFPHADLVGDKTVFNIRGNHYRLIVHIRYDSQIIFIKHLLTHAEYDKGTWKDD